MSYSQASSTQDVLRSTVPLWFAMRRWDPCASRPGVWTVTRFTDWTPGEVPGASCYGFWHAVMDDFGTLVGVAP